jgi:FkbM family methyltransferase
MASAVNNFTSIESIYGRFIVNRHCHFQAEHLIKTGQTHIEAELRNILQIVGTLPKDCVVVDAGANIGLISVPVAQAVRTKGGAVHAFEVQRMIFYALCGGAALNDLENLHVYRRGVGSASAVLKVPRPDYSAVQDFGTVSLIDQNGIGEHEDVEIVAIDDLGLPRLDLLKIDVEGMEIEVLKGARRMIAEYLPWSWVEYWKVDNDAIKRQFEGLDYKFYKIDQLNMLCAPSARAQQITISAPEF